MAVWPSIRCRNNALVHNERSSVRSPNQIADAIERLVLARHIGGVVYGVEHARLEHGQVRLLDRRRRHVLEACRGGLSAGVRSPYYRQRQAASILVWKRG